MLVIKWPILLGSMTCSSSRMDPMYEMYRGNGTFVAGKEYVAYDVQFLAYAVEILGFKLILMSAEYYPRSTSKEGLD